MTTTSNATAKDSVAADIYASINASSSSSGKTTTTSATQASQDKFLKLLTTQLQNQDPLNPMDNAQVTSQLAQINTVQGITQLNSTLQTMLDNSNANQAVQAAGLVGKGVVVPGSGMNISTSGSSSVAGYELAGAADVVRVDIKSSNGTVVRSIDIGSKSAGEQTFTWDGKDDAGAAVAAGSYTFSVSATQGANKVDATALQVGSVGSVSGKGSSLKINVTGVGSFGMSDIREIL
ncbi:MAG TPA: flagellar hook capping FlgD N-terminal domain-containing protein [Rhodocyclaceae bacterium]|nr:flagellar hook capping FlgD N-terminal domain-containing protein [Rhodocyclaceae bacterium]